MRRQISSSYSVLYWRGHHIPMSTSLQNGEATKAMNPDNFRSTVRKKPSLQGHKGDVLCLDVNPSGILLASGSSDKTIRIWDLQVGKCKQVCIPPKTLFEKIPNEPLSDNDEPQIGHVLFVSDFVLLVAIGSCLLKYNLDTTNVVISNADGERRLDELGEVNSMDFDFERKWLLLSGDDGIAEFNLKNADHLFTSSPPSSGSGTSPHSKDELVRIYHPHSAFVTSAIYIPSVTNNKNASSSSNVHSPLTIASGGFDCKIHFSDSKRKSIFQVDLNSASQVQSSSVDAIQMINPPYINQLSFKFGWIVCASGNGKVELINAFHMFRSSPLNLHSTTSTIFSSIPRFSDSPVLVSAGNDSEICCNLLKLPESACIEKYMEVSSKLNDLSNKVSKSKSKITKAQQSIAKAYQQTLESLEIEPSCNLQWKFKHPEKINWITTSPSKSSSSGNLFIADLTNTISCYEVNIEED